MLRLYLEPGFCLRVYLAIVRRVCLVCLLVLVVTVWCCFIWFDYCILGVDVFCSC